MKVTRLHYSLSLCEAAYALPWVGSTTRAVEAIQRADVITVMDGPSEQL